MRHFEWDEKKNEANITKHSISFEDAIYIFDGYTIGHVDDRTDYGEERIIALGELDARVLSVVYTMRGETCRLISARKANRDEREHYQTLFARWSRRDD